MTDSHGLAEAQLLDDVRDIRGIGRDLLGAVRLVAFAVTTQVDGHDPMPLGKVLGLRRRPRPVPQWRLWRTASAGPH